MILETRDNAQDPGQVLAFVKREMEVESSQLSTIEDIES